MNGGPVGQQQRFVTFAIVSLNVALTRLAIVDAQASLSFNG